ncbi:hypothetical protein BDU57DRAFT_111508 [Ampelomyces quisqualis]|uniref:Uncharacterized protein n=1 Tax=Ampelomyces quisqualis TaxID=50730 RepID=A0A6A5Q6I7_AMPQU|nr:hypothetical protein BDU57DRAFT_111508 [Ampelomyces quisqualis]
MAQHSQHGHDPSEASHRAAAPDETKCAHSDTLPPLYSLAQNDSHVTFNHAESQMALNKCSLRFAENVKAKFGDQSPETLAIYGVLDRFKHSKITKRETLSTICDILGHCNNLKHDLLEVLNHQDARWGPEDFDLPVPTEQHIPQFLQPVHEPQMRLPSISTLWNSSKQNCPSLSPELPNGLDNYQDFAQPGAHEHLIGPSDHDPWHATSLATFPSPIVPEQYENTVSIQDTSEGTGHAVDHPQWQAFECDTAMDPSRLESGIMPHQDYYSPLWDDLDYNHAWDEVGPGQLYEQPHEPFESSQFVAVPESIEARHADSLPGERRFGSGIPADPHQARLRHDTNAPPETTVRGDPDVGLDDDIAAEKPPSTRKRIREAPIAPSKQNEQEPRSFVHEGNESFSEDPTLKPRPDPLESHAKPSRKRSEVRGHYVHSLCGKSFASRSNVKKHHWGNKMDDPNTTTGCWFKHKKPSVSWNDHPSCRETLKPSPPKSYEARYTSGETKAPVVPAMIPSYHFSGFPALQSRPHIGADYINPTQTPQAPMHDAHDTLLSYHSHSLPRNPSSASFECLLTAVNLAAKIEEPRAKARNDSVVFTKLEAHALEAERTGQYEPAWHHAADHQNENVAHSQQHIHVSASTGFGSHGSAATEYPPMHHGNASHTGFQEYTFTQDTSLPDSGHRNLFSPTYNMDQTVRTLDAYPSPPQHQAVSSSPPPRPRKKRSGNRAMKAMKAMMAKHNSNQRDQ